MQNEYYLAKNQRRKNLHTKQTKYIRKGGNKKFGHGGNQVMIDVYEHTKEYCMSQFDSHNSYDGTTLINIFEYDPEIFETKETNDANQNVNENEKLEESPCIISVINSDTILAAIDLCNEGLSVAILNMASEFKPGGGVASGKTAQEECIFRKTNAFMTIPTEWYPLDPEKDLVYTKNVVIVKNDDNFDTLDEQPVVSLITLPGIRKPNLNFGNYSDEDRQLMSDKIESIFKVAIDNKNDALILGALGCGVFNNPPQEVAAIFKNMVTVYSRFFKQIVFAVMAKEGDHKSETNLKVFTTAFGNFPKKTQ